MTYPDLRSLCAELVDELHAYKIANPQHDDSRLTRARAALAVIDSAAELAELAELAERYKFLDDETRARILRSEIPRFGATPPRPVPNQPPGRQGLTWEYAVQGLKDVLADQSEEAISSVWQRSRMLDAIELMEANAPPRPVPVSERLPGPEDLDDSGRCWLFSKVAKEWRLVDVRNPGVPHLKYCFSHWLAAHDLPLPEVTPDTYLLSDAGYEAGTMWTGHGVKPSPEVAE